MLRGNPLPTRFTRSCRQFSQVRKLLNSKGRFEHPKQFSPARTLWMLLHLRVLLAPHWTTSCSVPIFLISCARALSTLINHKVQYGGDPRARVHRCEGTHRRVSGNSLFLGRRLFREQAHWQALYWYWKAHADTNEPVPHPVSPKRRPSGIASGAVIPRKKAPVGQTLFVK